MCADTSRHYTFDQLALPIMNNQRTAAAWQEACLPRLLRRPRLSLFHYVPGPRAVRRFSLNSAGRQKIAILFATRRNIYKRTLFSRRETALSVDCGFCRQVGCCWYNCYRSTFMPVILTSFKEDVPFSGCLAEVLASFLSNVMVNNRILLLCQYYK